MKKLRLKSISICLDQVMRLLSSGGYIAPPQGSSAPLSQRLTPGVKRGLKAPRSERQPLPQPRPRRQGRNGLWEEAKGRASRYAGISTKFPREAGATRPEIWRQKSDFVLKSTEKKAPAEGTRVGRAQVARGAVLWAGKSQTSLGLGVLPGPVHALWCSSRPQKDTQKSHSLKKTGEKSHKGNLGFGMKQATPG